MSKLEKKAEKITSEIKNYLWAINEQAISYVDDSEVTNSICRELRKIHKRIDKLNTIIRIEQKK